MTKRYRFRYRSGIVLEPRFGMAAVLQSHTFGTLGLEPQNMRGQTARLQLARVPLEIVFGEPALQNRGPRLESPCRLGFSASFSQKHRNPGAWGFWGNPHIHMYATHTHINIYIYIYIYIYICDFIFI